MAEEEVDTWNKFLLDVYEMYSVLCFLNSIIYFFVLFSSGNAALLVLSIVFQHLYNDFRQQCSVDGFSKPVNYLLIFIAVETALLACVIIPYIRKLQPLNRNETHTY
jgi:hypothetical protein